MTRRFGIVALVVLSVLAPTACSSSKKSGPSTPTIVDLRNEKTVAVDARNNQFSPPEIEILAGTTVTWTNRDTVSHNIQKFVDGADFGAAFGVQAGAFGPGATYSFTFKKLGDFRYTCTIHTLMDGTVHVVAPRAAAVTTTTG